MLKLKMIKILLTLSTIGFISNSLSQELQSNNIKTSLNFSAREDYDNYAEVVSLNPNRFNVINFIKKNHQSEPAFKYVKNSNKEFLLQFNDPKMLRKNACDIINAMELLSLDCESFQVQKNGSLYSELSF